MRILVLSDGWPPVARGGAEVVAFGLARAYRSAGHTVAVATTTRGPAKFTEATCSPVDGVQKFELTTSYPKLLRPYFSLWNPTGAAHVRRVAATFKPDCVHAHNVHRYLSYRSLVECRRLSLPVVLTLHDAMSVDYGRYTQGYRTGPKSVDARIDYKVRLLPTLKKYHLQYFPLRNTLTRRYLREGVDALCTVSQALADFLAANGVNAQHVIRNGVVLRDFYPPKKSIDALIDRFGLRNRKIITISGRLTPDKGSLQALRIFEIVAQRRDDVTLLLMGAKRGDDPEFDRQLRLSPVADKVVLTGWLDGDDIGAAFRASHVVLVPSICLDAFPTVVLEAMTAERPVVATAFGGAREAVLHGETGYIASPFNIRASADHVIELLSDEALATAFGQAGRAQVEARFSVEHSANAYLALMERLASGTG